MRKILMPIDGSRYSRKAIDYAGNLGLLEGNDVHLIMVIQTGYASKYMDGDINFYPGQVIHPKEHAQEVMDKTVAAFKEKGLDVTAHTPIGDPAQMILETAKEIDADLIVIGNRGLGAFSRAFLGSVSTKVMNHARCSVLIVKEKD